LVCPRRRADCRAALAACHLPTDRRLVFRGGLQNWNVEQVPGGSVRVQEDGALVIEDAVGCTVWWRDELRAPVEISYDVTVVSRGGPHDRVSDVDCFWMASDPRVAGRPAPFLNGTMPRFFSQCGEAIERNAPLLMRHPVRHYPYASALGMPLVEVLFAPFSIGQRPVGTVWIVAHNDSVHFDADDARRVRELSSFASLAIDTLQRSGISPRPSGEESDEAIAT
jgi:hypothetical protein